METKTSNILWLPSWYPSKVDAFNGDFIQRHANAVALFSPVNVFYVVKDSKRVVTDSIKIEVNRNGNLSETIIYYATPKYLNGFAENIYSAIRYFFIYKNQLQFLFKKEGVPKFVHVHVAFKAGLIALFLKWKFGVSYFVSEHWSGYAKNVANNFYERGFVYRFFVKRILRFADCVIPVSKDLGEKIKAVEPKTKFKIIPNTVNENLFYCNENFHKKFQFVHYTSSDIASKNTIGFLRVLAELHKIREDWECVIFGPADQKLKNFVTSNQLQQNIKFTGEILNIQVATLIRNTNLLVSFSNYETQSCTILEALCCGVPVIATKVGGVPEIVNRDNGLLIDTENEVGLLRAMETMMTCHPTYNRKVNSYIATSLYSYFEVGTQLNALYK